MKNLFDYIMETTGYFIVLFMAVYSIALGLIYDDNLFIIMGAFLSLGFSIMLNLRLDLGGV